MRIRRDRRSGTTTIIYSRQEHDAEIAEWLRPPYAYVEIEAVYHIGITAPGGARNFVGSAEDAAAAKADSLAFAARVCGLSKEQYLEWLRHDGAALCGADPDDNGKLCPNRVLRSQSEPGDWKAAHRQRLCKSHANSRG